MNHKTMNRQDIAHAVNYHYDGFPPRNINLSKVMPALLKATDALARYDQMLKTMHNSELLLTPLRNQEAVTSSRMEGTISTMEEIMQYEADYGEEEYTAEVRSDIIETLLYQRTLKNTQKAMEEGYPFSISLLKTMHQQLLSYGRGAKKSPGTFKSEQNYLADTLSRRILFIPISPEKLIDGLEALFDYINDDEIPILIKTAVTHLEFEALHPFQDGNGRIGRMLITLMLWHSKTITAPHFYISGYFEEHRNKYTDLMRHVSQTGNWDEWIIFFLTAIEQQAIGNLQIAENIRSLYEEMKTEFSSLLKSQHALTLLDFVFTYPIFRSTLLTEKTKIGASTANRLLKTLQEQGILRITEEGSGRKPTRYSFEKLMQLIRV